MTIKYYYLRDNENIQRLRNGGLSRGNPKVCIASELDREANVIKYSFSVAHKLDTFTKARAKQIASGRLATNPYTVVADAPLPCSSHELSKLLMRDILSRYSTKSDKNFSNQLGKLATRWMKFSEMPRVVAQAQSPNAV